MNNFRIVRSLIVIVILFSVGNLQADLIVNGSFEQPVVTDSIFFDTIPGWTKVGDSQFEIDNDFIMTNNSGKFQSADGAQHIELDGDSSYSILQSIATVPDSTYELRFAFAARPGYGLDENILGIYWNGSQIDTLSADGTNDITPNWNYFTYDLTATSSSTDIEFSDLGISDGWGTYLDGVSVIAVPEPMCLVTLIGCILFSLARRNKPS